jgi:hypothetical protein
MLRPGTQSRFRYRAPGLGLGHPAGHDRGVRARFQRGTVLAELGVAVNDLAAGLRGDRGVQVAVLGLFEVADRARQFAWTEQLAEPA